LLLRHQGVSRLLRSAPVPGEIVNRLNRERADVLAYILIVMSFVGINTAGLIGLDLLGTGRPHMSLTLIGGIFIGYALIIFRNWSWLAARHREPPAGRFFLDTGLLLFVVGALWGALFVLAMGIATAGQRNLLYAVIVACMSTSAIVAPARIAFAFWLPVSAGGIGALMLNSGAYDPFALICLIAYASLTGFCIVYLNRKLTERGVNAIRLEENAELIKLLLRDFEENVSDWLWETDAALDLQRISPRLAQVARKPAVALAGRFPEAMLGDATILDDRAGAPAATLKSCIAERTAFRDLVIPVIAGGEERIWSLTGKPTFDKNGQFKGYHGVGSDITAARRSEEQIAFLAGHDSLTQLPNRAQFSEALQVECAKCDQQMVSLLCLDIDDFKLINDTLGHATGDAVLVAVAERIRGCIRDGEIVARLGGDEFAIILPGVDGAEALTVADRLMERVSRPYHFEGRQIDIGLSIGIAQAPKDSSTPSGLQRYADLALHRAKGDGRGVARFYDQEMDDRFQDRRALQADLRQAALYDQLFLDFQPIIGLETGRVIGAEALLRWRHPERGLIPPGDFIELAEEAGVIGAIGAWVLREACLVAAAWPDDIKIAVNLSPLQFRDAGLVEMVELVLKESGLAPARLELEITESTVLETNAQTDQAIWKLHAMGIRIALDDFGTGYSSLSYLRRFPFDKIKIDRSFIRDLGQSKDDSAIILALIGLADSMNMVVTAEGVETNEQAALLTSYACAQGQGYIFSRPISAERLTSFIAATHDAVHPNCPNAAQ